MKLIYSLIATSIILPSLPSCTSSITGQPNQASSQSKIGIPKALKFRDSEEKRIVMEAAGIGGGLGIGIGLGTGQDSRNTIGLGSIGGLLGGGFGVKQVSKIRKLKLRGRDLEKLISATDRRTAEVRNYNLALRQYLVPKEVKAITLEQQVAERKKAYQRTEAALAKTKDSIAHIEAAITKSPQGNASISLRKSHENLVAQKNTLTTQQAQLLASN